MLVQSKNFLIKFFAFLRNVRWLSENGFVPEKSFEGLVFNCKVLQSLLLFIILLEVAYNPKDR